jgi:hypothetical protein
MKRNGDEEKEKRDLQMKKKEMERVSGEGMKRGRGKQP